MNFSLLWQKGSRPFQFLLCIILLILIGMSTISCSPDISPFGPKITPSQEIVILPTTPVLLTATPSPTLTLTPLPPLAILLAPPGTDPAQIEVAGSALSQMARDVGLRWEIRTSLSTSELTPDLRLVVAFPPAPGLVNIIQAAPGVQFLAVGIPGLPNLPNLSQVGPEGNRPEQAAFMAGILAAMVTDEWRVGVISLADTSEGVAARQAFLEGAVFFCGLCRQVHPPYYKYPLYVEFPSNASQAERLSAVNALADRYVKTVYLFPGASDAALVKALAEAGIGIIGGAPPGEPLPAQWVATVRANPAGSIQTLLPDLWNGKGGTILPMPLEIVDINPELFSPGRQALAQKYLAEMIAGVITLSPAP